MKAFAASLAGAALILGLGLTSLAGAQQPQEALVIEGSKDAPILLARMTVTATPLAEDGR